MFVCCPCVHLKNSGIVFSDSIKHLIQHSTAMITLLTISRTCFGSPSIVVEHLRPPYTVPCMKIFDILKLSVVWLEVLMAIFAVSFDLYSSISLSFRRPKS